MSIRTLYFCYFGLREPLVQTQVLPYLRQLASKSINVSLLTFEPQLRSRWSEQQLAEKGSQLAVEGIRWFYLPYHKRFAVPATFYDLLVGAWTATRLVRRYGIKVLHARGQIPMAMAVLVQRRPIADSIRSLWLGGRGACGLRALVIEVIAFPYAQDDRAHEHPPGGLSCRSHQPHA